MRVSLGIMCAGLIFVSVTSYAAISVGVRGGSSGTSSSSSDDWQQGIETDADRDDAAIKHLRACETDADCVTVGEGCAIDAVNAEFADEADRYHNARNEAMDCKNPASETEQKATCKQSQCVLGE
jgi:hypothetical protein